MKKFRGISLPELLLVVALFSLFLIIPYQIMKSGLLIGWRTESREDVGLQLRKAYFSLEKDLLYRLLDLPYLKNIHTFHV